MTSAGISPSTVWFLDADGDGYGKSGTTQTGCSQPENYVAQAGDCADGYASVFPGAPEICDGLRNDCSVDDWALYELTGSELDQDNDGFVSCDPSGGWFGSTLKAGGDCDDSDPEQIHRQRGTAMKTAMDTASLRLFYPNV